MSARISTKPVPDLQLFVELKEDGQIDSVTPVTWCLSPEAREIIKREATTGKPYLLIVVSKDGIETGRFLADLMVGKEIIKFDSDGEHLVHSTVVWSSDFSSKTVSKIIKDKGRDGRFTTDLLETFRPQVEHLGAQIDALDTHYKRVKSERRKAEVKESARRLQAELESLRYREPSQLRIRRDIADDKIKRLEFETQTSVTPDPVLFGKSWWLTRKLAGISWWDEEDLRDPCQARRRAIISLVTLPVVLVGGLVLFLVFEIINLAVIAWANILGWRNINYVSLKHPFIYPPTYIWRDTYPSRWWVKRMPNPDVYPGSRPYVYKEYRQPVFFVLNPPVLIVTAAVGWLISLSLGSTAFMWLAFGVVAVVALLLLLVASRAASGYLSKRDERRDAKAEQARQQKLRDMWRGVDSLACAIEPGMKSVRPPERSNATIHLKAAAIKAKVCKPFPK